MTNPTRQEIIDAHEALLELSGLAEELAVTEVEARQAWKYHAYILAALPPKPRPTMADVEWDNDKHYLAEAEQENGGNVIMLWKFKMGYTSVIGDGYVASVESKYLTPTGKRYTLTEVQDD